MALSFTALGVDGVASATNLTPMKLSLFSRVVIGFLFAFLMIVLLGVLDFFSMIQLTEAYQELEKSKNAIIALQRASLLAKDIQRAHCGFALTNDDAYLTRYHRAVGEAPVIKADLKSRCDGDEERGRSIERVIDMMERKITVTETSLKKQSGQPDDLAISVAQGRPIVDSLDLIITNISNEELQKQELLRSEIDHRVGRNKTIVVSSIISSVLLFCFGLLQLRRIFAERYHLYKDLEGRTRAVIENNQELATVNEKLKFTNEDLQLTVQRLEEARNKLFIQEQQLNHAQYLAKTGSFTIDIETRTFSYSDAFSKMLELEPGQAFDADRDFMSKVHPDDLKMVQDHRTNYFSQLDRIVEFRLIIHGKIKFVATTGTTVAEGTHQYFVGVISDITELKRTHEDLIEANTKLLQANASLEAFAYSISHDLKAPVRSIQIYSNLLHDKINETLSEEEGKWLDVVMRKARHMGELIEGLLALSKFGSLSLKKERVNMGQLVKELVDELTASHPKVVVRYNPRELGFVHADKGLIRQVWINLLINAFKFTEGKDNPEIEIDCSERSGFIEYSIRDNGVGFDQERASELFNVFKRLHPPEQFTGSGVGLAIVKRIIMNHGGTTSAWSSNGNGATFVFTLPLHHKS